MFRALIGVGLVLGALAEVGCASDDPDLRIETPTARAVLGQHLVQVTGTSVSSEVTVNGVMAMVVDGRFTVSVQLPEGPGSIVASSGETTVAIPVTIDTIDPVVAINSPAPASFIQGTTVRITGRAHDATLRTVLVNGVATQVWPDGTFERVEMVQPGGHRYRVVAIDGAGHEASTYTSLLAGNYAPMGTPVSQAFAVSIGPTDVQTIAAAATTYLSTYDFSPGFAAVNPVASDWWGNVSIVDLEMGTANIELLLGEGVITARVTIGALHVPLILDPAIGGGIDGRVTADRVTATVPLWVSAPGGRIEVRVGEPTLVFDNFYFQLDHFPGALEQLASVQSSVRTRVELAMLDFVRNTLPTYIQSSLALVTQEQEINFYGAPIRLTPVAATALVSPTGLRVIQDMQLTSQAPILQDALQGPGRLVLGSVAPTHPDGLYVDIAMDLTNAALFTSWSTGLLSLREDDAHYLGIRLTIAALSLLAPSVTQAAPLDAPVDFIVTPTLPYVMVPGTTGVEFQAPDMHLEAVARVDGSDVPLGTLSVAFTSKLRVDVVDGALRLGLEVTGVQADEIDLPDDFPSGSGLDDLVGQAVRAALETYGQNRTFPLPLSTTLPLTIDPVAATGTYITVRAHGR